MNNTSLLLLGVSHRTAPVELRERFALSGEGLRRVLHALAAQAAIDEVAVLSTCNRVEVVLASRKPACAVAATRLFFGARSGISRQQFDRCFYLRSDLDAVAHLFRVAAGLDSMVLGEPEILGQMRQAYQLASAVGSVGPELNPLFQAVLAIGKRVRAETALAQFATSVPGVAVELARKIFDSLADKRILVLGTGKMGEVATRCLAKAGARTVFVANRTYQKACALAARLGAAAVRYDDRWRYLAAADIVISSTGCPYFVFTRADGERLRRLRASRPLFFIDIAVPRDIDPTLNQLDGFFVYDIDSLQQVMARNCELREREVGAAETLLQAAVARYQEKRERRWAQRATWQQPAAAGAAGR